MILLRCPKFLRCLTADAPNFDRGHSFASLLLPLAALGSLPTSSRPRTPCTASTIFYSPQAVLLACKAALCYDNIVFV